MLRNDICALERTLWPWMSLGWKEGEATEPALQWHTCWLGDTLGICNNVHLRTSSLLSCPQHSCTAVEETKSISELWKAWF